MTQFNYHHLYYFKVIATEGSISKAAHKLRLGQPTLSMQLKQFEDFLGQALFDRKNRTLVLTEMGKIVLGYANEIFRLGEEMLDSVHDRPYARRLRLQIGALDSVPKNMIKALMNQAYAIDKCQITVIEGEGPHLIEELIHHRLDLVISNVSAPHLSGETLFSKSLAKMPLAVFGSAQFANLKNDFPLSLKDQPFVLPTTHSQVRHDFENYLATKKIKIDMLAETMDVSLMKTLALDGRGLIVAAAQGLKTLLDEGSLQKIGDLEGVFEEIWMLSAQRKLENPIAQRLMKDFTFTS